MRKKLVIINKGGLHTAFVCQSFSMKWLFKKKKGKCKVFGPHPRTSISEAEELWPSDPCGGSNVNFENCSEPVKTAEMQNLPPPTPTTCG